MSTAFNEFFGYMSAAVTADSGATGLSNTASPAYLRGGFWRADDTNNRTRNWPQAVVSLVHEDEYDAFGIARVQMLIQVDVRAYAQNRFVNLDATAARLRDVFHQWIHNSGSDSGSWTFGELQIRAGWQPESTPEETRYINRLRVGARKVA